MKKRVLIIGAGPAGLTAAYELLRDGGGEDYEVCVLEGGSVIGGISQTICHEGNRMDIGGHRFFSRDARVEEWWSHIMPTQGSLAFDDKLLGRDVPVEEGGPDPETCDRVMLIRHRISRIYWGGKFYDYPISLREQTFSNMGFGLTVKVGFSYLHSCFHKLPEDSLENFYINRFGRVLYSMFFEGYTEKVWGRPPSRIGADWGSQRVKGVSVGAILKNMFAKAFRGDRREVETSLIEQFRYPKYGPGQFWEAVAADVESMGGRVLLGCEVDRVHVRDGAISGIEYVRDGKRVADEADFYISSMPLKDLIADMDGTAVPTYASEIASGLPYRDFVTVGLLLPRLNLKNETDIPTLGDIVPDCWIYIQNPDVKLGRIQVFNNWSPYLVADPVDTVWIGLEYFCDEGDEFWEMDDRTCVDFAVAELVSMGVIDSASDVLDSHRVRVKKAYPAYFDTYDRIDELVGFLSGFPNLFCVGRNGQHRYNNMDHSMATSLEAVADIRSGAVDRSNVWTVNTEGEYHESRKG